MSHHKEAGSEGTHLGVVPGSLRTLRLFNAKRHQQVGGVRVHGDHLCHEILYYFIPTIYFYATI